MEYRTQYGIVKDGKMQPGGIKAPKAIKKDETSEVERDGYRTLKQQIQELEDAGLQLIEYYKKRYPATPIPPEDPKK